MPSSAVSFATLIAVRDTAFGLVHTIQFHVIAARSQYSHRTINIMVEIIQHEEAPDLWKNYHGLTGVAQECTSHIGAINSPIVWYLNLNPH